MHCIEDGRRRDALLRLSALASLLSAGLSACVTTPSAPPAAAAPAPAPRPAPAPVAAARPAPAPVAPAPVPAPAPSFFSRGPDLGPPVALPPPTASRTMDEFKKAAARRMVAGSPKAANMGKLPPMLYAIAVIEIEVDANGRVRDINVVRKPAKDDAQDTIDIAKAAIHRGAPYGDMSRLPRPWKWVEVFLFDDDRRFKPRVLD